jgi:CubicO group peptidase (beta-lactamase class C family)
MNTLGLAAGLLLAFLGPAAFAQRASTAQVDKIFAEWDKPDSPGCAVGVIQNGRFLYQRGYGMANLDYDIPNSPEMVYYVGSDSKQFTAASIALLSLQGKLSLDDPVRKYIPELRDYGAPLTIRHLIHHSSGIRDIYGLMSLRGDRMEDVFPDSAALALITRQIDLAFTPGAEYSYSNSGYFLLGQIVKRVSGKSLREFADEQIFRPLGMTQTHFHDDPGHIMKRRAMSYERDGKGGYRISYIQNFDKIGAGGLYTTLDDLRKWDENYYTKQVGGDALQRLIHTRGILNTGDTLPYAFGNIVGTSRGLRTVEHSGSLMGYKANILRFPDQHFSVLATCNLGAIDPGPLSHAVAEVFLGSKMGPQPRIVAATDPRQTGTSASPTLAVPLGVADAAQFVGDYYSADLDVTYRVSRAEDGRLMLGVPRRQPLAMTRTDGDQFRAGSWRIRFVRDDVAADGGERRVRMMVLTVSRIGDMRLVRR